MDDLELIAKEIIYDFQYKKIALLGEMGAGKTTFVKIFCKVLGIKDLVNSPTFTILNEYKNPFNLYHFDFYRIKSADEIFALGFEEYLYSDEYVIIEWAEKMENFLPDFYKKLSIQFNNIDKRIFTLTD